MTPSVDEPLFADFAPADDAAWRAAAEEALDGAPFDRKLVTRIAEGIDLQPIYTAASSAAPVWQRRAPGFAPFVRGIDPLGAREQAWLICQEPLGRTLADCNRSLLEALDRGQNAVFVRPDAATRLGLEPTGVGGLPLASLSDVRTLLGGVDLGAVPVMIPAGLAALPLAALLGTHGREAHGRTDVLHGAILADPWGEWVRQGRLPGGIDGASAQMASLVRWAGEHAPRLRTVGVDAALWGDAGAHAVQELAFGLATGVDYLRRLDALGVGIEAAAGSLVFSWSVGSHIFLEIAKLRAARLLWARAVEAAGGAESARRLVAHGRLTGWNKTLLDPHTNLVRTTTEAFAAVVGGCQSIEIPPFDAVAGGPTGLSGRLARNLHVILAEECQLGRVVDPAGGSHFVETVTWQLAEKAWALFQDVEKRGGMAAALAEGYPQGLVEQAAAGRVAAVESRREGVIGTNVHPNLREEIAAQVPAAACAVGSGASSVPGPELARLDPAVVTGRADWFEALGDAFVAGASLASIKARLDPPGFGPAITVVVPRRRAEPFERLRRRAEAHLARSGSRPRVFLAALGPRRQHAARAEFSAGFFAAGGFEVVPNPGFPTPEAAASAALADGAPVVVLCSTDDTYPALVPPLAGALKAAGPRAPVVVLAGLPATPELQAQFRSAGVDEFIHLRANCARLLAGIQDRLGLPPA